MANKFRPLGGHAGQRPYLTPDNHGLSNRANTRLESLVASVNDRSANAIAVEAVAILLWQRRPSSQAGFSGRRCTCHSGVAIRAPMGIDPALPVASPSSPNLDAALTRPTVVLHEDDDDADYEIVGIQTPRKSDPEYTVENINTEIDNDKFFDADEEDVFTDLDTTGVLDTQKGAESDFAALEAFVGESGTTNASAAAQPYSFFGGGLSNAENTSCPVCATATYVEAWQPFGGSRSVFSFHPEDTWSCTQGAIAPVSSSHPLVVDLMESTIVTFDLAVPAILHSVPRIGVWNGRAPAQNVNLELHDPVSDRWDAATPDALRDASQLRNLHKMRLVAPVQTRVTHVDVIAMLTDLPKIQFAPMSSPLASEYPDYAAQMQVECSAALGAMAGDVISDTKYRRCWRVSNANKRFTAGGASLTMTLDLSTIDMVSPLYSLQPYLTINEQGRKFSRLESFQGDGDMNVQKVTRD